MKKVLALLLCCVMLLTIASGCKKDKPEELTDARVIDDLEDASYLYAYNHIVGTPVIREITIAQRTEKGDFVSLTVDADIRYSNAIVNATFGMTYQRIDLGWKLERLSISKAELEPTAAPDANSVLAELTNYMSIVGSAYSLYGESYQPLYFNLANTAWEMAYEPGATTAALTLSLVSDKLDFVGTYALTFGESGWTFETVKQDDGRRHPLLRLTSLEQKDGK